MLQHEGSVFTPPILSPVEQVFAMSEGLVLSTVPTPLPTEELFAEVARGCPPRSEERTFSYFSLSFHPLSEFRPLYLNETTPFVGLKEKILFSSRKMPIVLTYDFSERRHNLYVAQYDFQELQNTAQNINFDKTIHLLDPSDLNFADRVFRSNPIIVLKAFHFDAFESEPAAKVELISSILDDPRTPHRTFHLYLHLPNGQLRMIEIALDLKKVEEKSSVVVPSAEQSIAITTCQEIFGLEYFRRIDSLFPVEFHFERPRNANRDLFAELERTLSKNFFRAKIKKNAILARNGDVLHLYHKNEHLAEFDLEQLASQTAKGRAKIDKISRRMVSFSNGSHLILPGFTHKLFDLLLATLPLAMKPQTFWQIVSDLMKHRFGCSSSQRSVWVSSLGSEADMICGYFSGLLARTFHPKEAFAAPAAKRVNSPDRSVSTSEVANMVRVALNEPSLQGLMRRLSGSLRTHPFSFEAPKDKPSARHLPEVRVNSDQFRENIVDCFLLLHALNEDLRLLKVDLSLQRSLTLFLVSFVSALPASSSQAYIQHYFALFPDLVAQVKTNLPMKASFEIALGVSEDSPPVPTLPKTPFDSLKTLRDLIDPERREKAVADLLAVPCVFVNHHNLFGMLGLMLNVSTLPPAPRRLRLISTEVQVLQFLPLSPLYKQKETKAKQQGRSQVETQSLSLKLFDRIFQFLAKNKVSLTTIDSMVDCVAFVFKSILRIARREIHYFLQHSVLPKRAFDLIRREDVRMNLQVYPRYLDATTFSATSIGSIRRESLSVLGGTEVTGQKKPRRTDSAIASEAPDQPAIDIDSILSTLPTTNAHYSKNDILFKQLYRGFNCSEPITFHSKFSANLQREGSPEEQINPEIAMMMVKAVTERLSVFVARGAVDLSTEPTTLTEVVKIPEVSMVCRFKEDSFSIPFVFNQDNPEDLSAISWAQFHHGVAAALRVSRRALDSFNRESIRTWIDYQQADTARYDHAGLLFGLGLLGLFDCFTIVDIFANFTTCNDARIIGILFGLAIPKIYSKQIDIEEAVLKCFDLHLEFNYSAPKFKISRIVQSAAFIGMGIYHKGLSKKSSSETLLTQIAARPFNENNADRECHSLSAGFALGLINLGRGSKIPSAKDINLDERLFRYIDGGSEAKPETFTPPSAVSGAARSEFQSSNVHLPGP